MALAAYDTILKHLKNNNETFADYDLILTGDLSIVGSCMLKKLFLETGLKLNNHADCGELIYNIKKQKEAARNYDGPLMTNLSDDPNDIKNKFKHTGERKHGKDKDNQ